MSLQILDNGENGCACEAGWQGEKCDKCVPYWNCPNQKSTQVVTVWIILDGEDFPRFITAYPGDKS